MLYCERNCYKCAFLIWYQEFANCVWELKSTRNAQKVFEEEISETSEEDEATNDEEKKDSEDTSYNAAYASFSFLNLLCNF